jgi:catechol 2,3-dioxygenase-like lactoylglutathione lyase family enzyme
MSPAVESMIAVTYVRDIDAARAFYELLGFHAGSTRRTETAGWLVLRQGEHTVLLTATEPRLELPALPLLFYFFYADLEPVLAALEAAGVEVARLGHAPHAAGGEARIVDPDGNTILLGQRRQSGAGGDSASGDRAAESRFSVLREAAALVAASGGAPASCQVSGSRGERCPAPAEVRLADSAGTAIWACLAHADEVLVMVPGAFVASDEGAGIAHFLALRHG